MCLSVCLVGGRSIGLRARARVPVPVSVPAPVPVPVPVPVRVCGRELVRAHVCWLWGRVLWVGYE